jgi:serine/threonine protein kinase
MPYKEPKPVSELVPNCTNPEAIDLLTKMLQFNPEKRISALDALRHPYLKRIRDQLGEELCSKKFDFSYEERVAGDLSEIKREAWNTLLEFCKITRKCETDIVSPHAGCDSPVTESSPDPIQKELNLRLESQNVLSKTQEKKTKRNVLSRIKRFFGKCK